MPREITLYCFGLAALWDGTTTAFGIAGIIGADGFWSYVFCLVGGVVILGFGISTREIFANSAMPYPVLKALWWTAFSFDVATSWYGNVAYIVLHKRPDGLLDALTSLTLPQLLLALGLTVLVSSAPVMLSYILEAPAGKERATA